MKSLHKRRWHIFKKNRLAYWSFLFLSGVLLIALLTPLLANERPLIIRYRGETYFPIIEQITDQELGGDLPTLADYSDPTTLEEIRKNGFIISSVIPYSAETVDYFAGEPFPIEPSRRHWLGTDDQGRDLLARLLYGLRLSLWFGLLLTFFASCIGFCVGAVQGYFGGKTDLIIGRFIEIWGSLPQLFILIILAGLLKPSFWVLLIILILFGWPQLTGVVRTEFLRVRGLDYVRAAKSLGASDLTIMFRHILPNALVATTTYLPFILSGAIVALSALDFLGLGLPPGTPSLGEIIREAKENLNAPWIGISVFVLMTILLAVLLLIGEGVRMAFDPHIKEQK